MNKKKNIFIILLLILHGITLIVFCNIDKIQLIQNGLRYQLFNMDYSISFETINQEVAITIKKEKLDLMKNEIIYENDGCTITIDSIEKNNENYIMYFSSHGIYNQNSGKLVTGIKHYFSPNKRINDEINVSCFIDNIQCKNNSFSGLNFKDGDEFSFIIDSSILENGERIILKNLLLIKMEKIT